MVRQNELRFTSENIFTTSVVREHALRVISRATVVLVARITSVPQDVIKVHATLVPSMLKLPVPVEKQF